jgi:hypothetical protein
MSKVLSTDVFAKMLSELQKLEDAERIRIINAIRAFFDSDAAVSAPKLEGPKGIVSSAGRTVGGAVAFFEKKQPKNKIEELAVAARYREEAAEAEVSSQEDLAVVFREARRTFDANNFRRDIENARVKKLFTRGTGRGIVQLSAVGQKMVDALPERLAVKARKKNSRKG